MDNLGLFIQFGVRAAGGPAFLKRTRTAFAYTQRQRQNSTGATFSQLQRRDGTGFTYTDSGFHWVCNQRYPYYSGFNYAPGDCNAGTWNGVNPAGYGCGWTDYGFAACDKFYWSSKAAQCHNLPNNLFSVNCWQSSHVGNIRYNYSYQGYQCAFCCEYHEEICQYYSNNVCGINWGGWYAVGSCSANYSCFNGSSNIDCQTVSGCNWNVTQSWYNVASCSPSTPACTNGASRIECRDVTMYDWNAWSAYEEVDICVPQSPAAAAGAVQIECVPQ